MYSDDEAIVDTVTDNEAIYCYCKGKDDSSKFAVKMTTAAVDNGFMLKYKNSSTWKVVL